MRLQILISVLIGLLTSACAMVESSPLERAEGFRCDSYAGAYFLPKTTLVVEVEEVIITAIAYKENADSTPINKARRDYSLKLNYRRVPDARFGFCLDYLARPTSDDIVNVRKYKESQLLGLVSSDAVDESRFALQTLIRSAFILASGDPTFGSSYGRSFAEGTAGARKVTVFKAELDPFDATRTAEINQALHDYGYCLVMPGFSFNRSEFGINSYCEHPRHLLNRVGAPDVTYRHKSSEDVLEQGRRRGGGGVFYRPRILYPLHVYVKDNAKVPSWRLGISRVIEMENISPLVAVGIDRTMFAQRKTTLTFDEGQLSNVCIYKGSELLAASYIPLQIVQSIVALPTAVIQVKIDQTQNLAALTRAEDELIKTQIAHLKYLSDLEADPTKATPATAVQSNTGTFVSHRGKDDNKAYTTVTSGLTGAADREKTCPTPDATVLDPLLAGGVKYQNILTPASVVGGTPPSGPKQ